MLRPMTNRESEAYLDAFAELKESRAAFWVGQLWLFRLPINLFELLVLSRTKRPSQRARREYVSMRVPMLKLKWNSPDSEVCSHDVCFCFVVALSVLRT